MFYEKNGNELENNEKKYLWKVTKLHNLQVIHT